MTRAMRSMGWLEPMGGTSYLAGAFQAERSVGAEIRDSIARLFTGSGKAGMPSGELIIWVLASGSGEVTLGIKCECEKKGDDICMWPEELRIGCGT